MVDDSAFMRKILRNMLTSDSRITVVGDARNGEQALAQVKVLKPDVMTLDIEMPGINGLEVLRRLMDAAPMPVIMVSSLTEQGAKATLTALELGAVDYIPKHLQGSAVNIIAIQHELIEKVVAAHEMRPKLANIMRSHDASCAPSQSESVMQRVAASTASRGTHLVAIGSSTGGPKALQSILPSLPKDFPAAILIVQHMPKFFTGPFAQRLDQLSEIEVREAVDGDVLAPGLALLAPGGIHLTVERRPSADVTVVLTAHPTTRHMPSADVMMVSVAGVFASRAVGVILTGMGHDGQEGMKAIKAARGRTIAQDEQTCAVYGMPKAVAECGLADKVVPLGRIAGEIVNMV